MKNIGTIVGRLNAVFSPSELEALDVQLYKEFLPQNIVRELVTIKDERNPGASVVTYKKLQLTGGPGKGFVSQTGTAGVPLVNTKLTLKANPVKDIVYGVVIGSAERDSAQSVGQNLEEVNMGIVAYFLARDENTLFFAGNTDLGVTGILSAGTAVTGTTGGWTAATAGLTIYNDVRIAYGVLAGVDGLRLDQLALVLNPIHKANLLKMLSATNPNTNALQTITASNLFPRGIFFSETIATDKGIVLSTAPEHCQLSVVKDVTRNPEVWQPNGDMVVTWTLRTAGPLLRYTESCAVLSGL